MKKILNSVAVLAIGFAMATSFTSCHRGSDVTVPTPVVTDEVVNETHEIIITSNVRPTSVFYNGTNITGRCTITTNADGTYTITYNAGNSNGGTITVNADGYIPQEATVSFADNATQTISVYLVKPSTNIVDQADVNNADHEVVIENDEENKEEAAKAIGDSDGKIDASITVNAGTNILNSGDGSGFSITAYTPAAHVSEETTNTIANTNETTDLDPIVDQIDVLAVRCTPDGATFSEPVKVSLTIPGAGDHFIFKCRNSENEKETLATTVAGNNVSVMAPHFSDWVFSVASELEKIGIEPQPLVNGTQDNSSSSARISVRVAYTKKTGNKIISSMTNIPEESQTLIRRCLRAYFGSLGEGSQDKTTSITVNAFETVEYTIYQTYKDITIVFPRENAEPYTVVVRQYSGVKSKISRTSWSEEPDIDHIGSSN